jgi:GNAT superfamily N-acetyltransferase
MIHELAVFEEAPDEVAFDRAELAGHLFGPSPAARVHIAEVDGAVAGMAVFFPTFSTWVGRPGIWLEDLFVRPAFRRAGVGAALLDSLVAATDGRVEWSVLDWNESALAFYRSRGARPVEGWTRYRLDPGTGGSGR